MKPYGFFLLRMGIRAVRFHALGLMHLCRLPLPVNSASLLPLQVMAIATLAACYNNEQVFKGVVKIRRGQAVTLMMDATNLPAVKAIFQQYTEEVGTMLGLWSRYMGGDGKPPGSWALGAVEPTLPVAVAG